MTYEKKVLHGCDAPTVAPADQFMVLRWTCPDCGATWYWHPSRSWPSVEHYGFLGMRCRTVERVIPGYWHTEDEGRRGSWQEAS